MTIEIEHIVRSYEAQIADVLPGERAVVAIINTAAVDRFKTVIDPAGIDVKRFVKNPVVLWEHGKDPQRGRVPIARNAWIKVRKAEKDIIAKTIFREDAFSDELFRMYQDGTLKGFSVDGLMVPGACGPPTADEVRKRPELADCKIVYRALDLIEYSAVAMPGNPEALALAVSRGLWIPDDMRASLPAIAPLPKLVGRTFEQVEDALMRQSRSLAGSMARQALQDARDLARGDI
jgi:hypothetical protein